MYKLFIGVFSLLDDHSEFRYLLCPPCKLSSYADVLLHNVLQVLLNLNNLAFRLLLLLLAFLAPLLQLHSLLPLPLQLLRQSLKLGRHLLDFNGLAEELVFLLIEFLTERAELLIPFGDLAPKIVVVLF